MFENRSVFGVFLVAIFGHNEQLRAEGFITQTRTRGAKSSLIAKPSTTFDWKNQNDQLENQPYHSRHEYAGH
jgi:hypothetical protein